MSAGPAQSTADHAPVLPKAVREAAAAADALMQPPPPDDPPAGDPPPAPSADAPATPPAPEAPKQDDHERTANELKAAIGRLRDATETIRNLHQRLDIIETENAELKEKLKDKPATPPPSVTDDPKDLEEYGEGMVAFVNRKAQQMADAQTASLKQTIDELKADLGKVAGATVRNETLTFQQALHNRVPDWLEINQHPEFVAWANSRDALSGKTYGQMLNEAYAGQELERVVTFFETFKAAAAAPDPTTAQAPSTPPGVTGASGKVPLEQFAAPGRAGSEPPAQAPDKRTYRAAEVTQFFVDKAMGKWKGREAEFARMEADIFAAQGENRIVP